MDNYVAEFYMKGKIVYMSVIFVITVATILSIFCLLTLGVLGFLLKYADKKKLKVLTVFLMLLSITATGCGTWATFNVGKVVEKLPPMVQTDAKEIREIIEINDGSVLVIYEDSTSEKFELTK